MPKIPESSEGESVDEYCETSAEFRALSWGRRAFAGTDYCGDPCCAIPETDRSTFMSASKPPPGTT